MAPPAQEILHLVSKALGHLDRLRGQEERGVGRFQLIQILPLGAERNTQIGILQQLNKF